MPPLSRGLWKLPLKRAHIGYRSSFFTRRFGSRDDFFKVSEEVRDALHNGKPVVALETTIYTHGMLPRQLILLYSIFVRLSLPGKCRFIVPPRISCPYQRRHPCNDRRSQWHRTGRHAGGRADRIGFDGWKTRYHEGVTTRFGLHCWVGNIIGMSCYCCLLIICRV